MTTNGNGYLVGSNFEKVLRGELACDREVTGAQDFLQVRSDQVTVSICCHGSILLYNQAQVFPHNLARPAIARGAPVFRGLEVHQDFQLAQATQPVINQLPGAGGFGTDLAMAVLRAAAW